MEDPAAHTAVVVRRGAEVGRHEFAAITSHCQGHVMEADVSRGLGYSEQKEAVT